MRFIKFSVCQVLILLGFLCADAFGQKSKVQGKLKAAIEIGSDGFNSFVITIDEEQKWQLEKADYGSSNVIDGIASETSILEGLQSRIDEIKDFGVAQDDIHIIASSGALIKRSVGEIIDGLSDLGYEVTKVTTEEEGIYGYLSAMKPRENKFAFVIDVGAGNTKISWMENGEIISKSTYGSKYYLDFEDDETVYNAAKAIAEQMDKKFSLKAYVMGGVPYQLASKTRKGKEKLTTLADLESFEAADEKQVGGLQILKGIRDGVGAKRMIFNWEASFAIGYLLKQPY